MIVGGCVQGVVGAGLYGCIGIGFIGCTFVGGCGCDGIADCQAVCLFGVTLLNTVARWSLIIVHSFSDGASCAISANHWSQYANCSGVIVEK